MKITFIIPPYNKRIDERFGLPHPIGVLSVATVLKEGGHQVRILDCDAMGIDYKKLRSVLLGEAPQVVGVTATTQTRFSAIRCVDMAKEILPCAYIVVGGPHFSATSEDALQSIKNIDFVVRGEGEDTLLELVSAIQTRNGFNQIEGLSYREGGKIVHTEDRQPIMELDKIPILDRSLVKEGAYSEKLPHSDFACISVLSSRGCPFGCTFCFPHHRNYRRRSVENIFDEVEYLLNKFEINAIRFFDLTFTVNRDNVINFCSEIIKRKLRFHWYCESRVDIDLKMLELMKEAGLYSLDFGVESVSDKVLKAINKKIDMQQALSFAKRCKELDIKTKAFFMMSLPEETIEDAEETFKFVHELSKHVTTLGASITHIIPGTELEKRARDLNILPVGFSWNSKYKSDKSRIFTSNDAIPIYIEKLPYDYLITLYQRYSIFELYSKKGNKVKFVIRKIYRGLFNWDKGFYFKLKWLFSLLKYKRKDDFRWEKKRLLP